MYGLSLTLLAGTGFFAYFVHRFYPIQNWLFWHYAVCWLRGVFWGLGCLAAGNELLARSFGQRLALLDRLSLGFASGVLAFGLSIFLLGLAGGLNVFTFFALPGVFIALGARRLIKDVRGLHRHRVLRRTLSFEPLTLFVVVAGVLGIGVLYFQALTPDVFSFDVRWYHMPIAQRYALTGRVARLEEGFFLGTYPQLSTYLYSWAFLSPRTLLFDKLQTCLVLEVLLFLATLSQIPLLLRRLLPRMRVGLTWVVLLLFPGIYLYDSNLHAGADHIAAFWALPIALTFWRSWRNFTAGNVVLSSIFISAAALTKYSALCIVVPPALALLGRGLYLAVSRRTSETWRALGLLVLLPALLTTPHWLKNWLWYGDPAYPVFHSYLSVRPWNPDAAAFFNNLPHANWTTPLTLSGVLEALKTTVTFAFVPNDWPVLHRDWPVFGMLFTLTLPCLPFLRGAKRVAWLYLLAMSSVFVWYMMLHQDRMLQAILPWMAAATGGVIVLVWRSGEWARGALVPLLALQCVWGGDIPFFRTHNGINESSLRYTAQFLASGFEGRRDRFRVFEPMSSIGVTLPKDAVVVVHTLRSLGIDRVCISDRVQGRFSYARLLTPVAIHQELKQLGVTHALWPNSNPVAESLAGELAFVRYVRHYTHEQRRFGAYNVGRLPDTPPTEASGPERVAYWGCGQPYQTGWYELGDMTYMREKPDAPALPRSVDLTLEQAAAEADFIVVDRRCHKGLQPDPTFESVANYGPSDMFLRRRP